jgi:hypothetical protein
VKVELEPGQPAQVVRAVADLIAPSPRPIDPWWASGRAAFPEAAIDQDDATARPRSKRGADRA